MGASSSLAARAPLEVFGLKGTQRVFERVEVHDDHASDRATLCSRSHEGINAGRAGATNLTGR